ncbi:YihY/virulence factor BrkB family protein [Roseicella aerolata]|uniref:YihY/virulence factor BrkB family protein n=1 Tax=Roseicella aerolata TaxID=2883479 RepID=A0A9X1I8Z7_9PROT|nr:YihY/virulence factor BrkB family protein [Roseicella aerolata]MCB4820399.1 YihY/virulence factor BrkB family protein [Roseicella aerolata]
MPAERRPNPLLATLAAAGGLVMLMLNRGGESRRPARAVARGADRPARREAGDDRGRTATSPTEIPARGWWDILKRTAYQVSEDRVLTEAAGITFYTLLALFPALAALISIYGLFADPAEINGHLAALGGVIPGGGMEILTEQVQRISATASGTLGFGAVIGLATSLWSANQAMKAFVDSLNIVYEEKEERGFFKRLLVTMAFTLAGILFIVLAMVAVVAIPVVLSFIGLGGTLDAVLRLARWPVMLLAVALFLACLYRYGPDREEAQWRWVSWGSAFASVAWVAFSLGFSWYVTNFGNFNETYGSLGAVIGFMTWIWLSSTVVLVGAELDAEMEHQTARDTTKGPERPMGARGARMADTVAG